MKIRLESVQERLRFETEHKKAQPSPDMLGDDHGYRKSERRASNAT